MTREDIIQMAQKAGFVWLGEYHSNLEDFAKLVAQHEREACEKVCEAIGQHNIIDQCVAAIRTRKQA
jgi:hypothetical protein